MNLESQKSLPQKLTAVTRFQSLEAHKDFCSATYENRSAESGGSLAIYLTIHTLERTVKLLMPFYGPDCSVAIYEDGEHESLIARSTLGAIEGWTPPHLSLLLLIG